MDTYVYSFLSIFQRDLFYEKDSRWSYGPHVGFSKKKRHAVQLKFLFYYINIILAKGQNNRRMRLLGVSEINTGDSRTKTRSRAKWPSPGSEVPASRVRD